jgi:NADH-quinone oxidoreductase subunit M
MSILFILLVLPLVGAVAAGYGKNVRKISILCATAMLALVIYLMANYDRGNQDLLGYAYKGSVELVKAPQVALAVGVDGLGLLMILLTALVTFAAMWNIDESKAKMIVVASWLISAGAMGAFISMDVLMMYAFHELALIPTLLVLALCGLGEKGGNRRAAWRMTLYLGFGSMILLAGILVLVFGLSDDTVTFNLAELTSRAKLMKLNSGEQAMIYGLLLVGFGTLVSLFPFHGWAAEAYAKSPTPVAMLHSGVLKKFGLYGMIKLGAPLLPNALEVNWLMNAFLLMIVGNLLVIGWVTMTRRRLDDILANSSVMHMGYIFLGIAANNELALRGAVLLMFAHGISIALMFGLAGRMNSQLGTLELNKLGGLGSHSPATMVLFAFGAFASIGLPGLANFAGEVMVFFGAFAEMKWGEWQSLHTVTVIALWGVVVSAVYMLRAYRKIFQGTANGELVMKDGELRHRVGYVVLAAVLLIVGVCPWLLLEFLGKAFLTVIKH